MRTRTWTVAAAVGAAALGAAGCAGAGLVKARAAEDLRCPEKEITIESREMDTYDARGCGRHASYAVRAGEVMSDNGREDDLPAEMPKMPKME
jgi:hypothetical protein